MATTRKKIVVYVEEEFKAEWERLAAKRFRPASVEAERLMVLELEQAYTNGELERPTSNDSSDDVSYDKAVAIVKANADKGQTRTLAILETAQLLGLKGEKLLEMCIDAGLKPKNGKPTTEVTV